MEYLSKAKLQEAIRDYFADEDVSPDDVIREEYSGRAMYGETCLGLVVSYACDATMILIHALRDDIAYGGFSVVEMMVCCARFDNMATKTIVYFPGTRLFSEDEDDE